MLSIYKNYAGIGEWNVPVIWIGHFEIWFRPSWWFASESYYVSWGPFAWRLNGIFGRL